MGYMSNKLQRCECGGEVELNGCNGGYVWYAICEDCRRRSPSFERESIRESQKAAIEWWNSENAPGVKG